MKRAATTLMLMLAAVASAAVVDVERASWREGEGGKTQWAPTRSFRGLNAHPVFTGERGRAASPYAGEEGETAAGGKEAGFTGHRLETTLGLTYAEQRWLDSSTGSFLSRDPVGASSYLARPNELYAFGYAAGNPARFVDPDGRRACFEGEEHTKCEERLRRTGRLAGSVFQPTVPSSFRHPLEEERQAAIRRNERDARLGVMAVGVGMTLAGGAGLPLLAAEGAISGEVLWVGSMATSGSAGAAFEYGMTGKVSPEGVLTSAVLGPVGVGPSVQLARSELAAYSAYRTAVSPLVAPAAHSVGDIMLAEARAGLSTTLSEVQMTAARRYAWSRSDSMQLYRELGVGAPMQSVADEPLRLAAGSVPQIDIALGLSGSKVHSFGPPSLLQRFSLKLGDQLDREILHYGQWERAGLADDSASFAEMFFEAANRADQIHFNLSGISGIQKGVYNYDRTFLERGSGRVTEAELAAILRSPKLRAKTFFYLDGRRLEAHEIPSLILTP